MVGQTVDVEGIVVGSFHDASHLKGFYLQEPDATWDGDPLTSEGIFIFDNAAAVTVNVGDRVRVRGTVDEFPSSGSFLGNTQNSSLTEIGTVVSELVCSTGNTFTRSVVSLPTATATDLERFEGMAVQITQPLTVTGNFSLGTFDQIDLAPALLYAPTVSADQSSWAAKTSLNARSVIALDDASTLTNANLYPTIFPQGGLSATNTLRSGDLVNYDSNSHTNSPLVGVLDDRFGEYRIQPTAPVTFYSANPRPPIAPILTSVGGRFRAVSANVLNFFTVFNGRGAANQTEFDHQKTKMVEALGSMDGDIYGISEVQNFANGQTSGGTYTNAAVQSIVDGLNCRKASLPDLCTNPPAGPYVFVDTLNLGGDNGTDAIRSVIIYRSDRLMTVGSPVLYNQADQNRPTLAQTFQPATGAKASSQTFTFVVNHFRSKGSACPSGNDPFQGNCNGMRLSMAQNVVSWLAANPTSDPLAANRRLLLVGDFNAYFGEDPIQYFQAQGYTNLINQIIGGNAYSYNFGSQAGYLDHAIANPVMNLLVKSVAEWHNNADEPSSLQALDSNLKSPAAQIAYYGADPYAASDHDPIVIGFNPLCGDLNDDGVVDAVDQAIMRAAIGKLASAGDRRLDFDGDGKITLTDFTKWSVCSAAFQR
jgi:predicted extracellular nuclease